MAKEKGFFARHGLDVDLINYSGSTDQLLETLATGKADAAAGMALRWLNKLDGHLQAARPGEDWQGSERFSGDNPMGMGEGAQALADIGELEQRHPEEADQLDQLAGWLDLPRLHGASGLDLTGIGLLLGQRHDTRVPVMCTDLLEDADLVDGLRKSAVAVTLGRGLEPLQARRVGAGPSAVCSDDHMLRHCRWNGGTHRTEDLRLHRRKCVTSPVLQAARS